MGQKKITLGQGSIYQQKGWWWCNYVAGGVRRREPCKTKIREEALNFLHRRQGKLASGEFLTPDQPESATCLSCCWKTTTFVASPEHTSPNLEVKSILNPALGDVKAAKLTSEQIKQYIQQRLKKIKPSTVNRESGILHRAFQLGYQQDPPLVGRVPYFPKLSEGEPRRGFLKPSNTVICLRRSRRN